MVEDFKTQVQELRPYLMRFASLQLRNPEAAEDAVQEALAAALAAEKSFAGRANLRTWLTGILKHKIVDAIRKAGREVPLPEEEVDRELGEFDGLFKENGHWQDRPAAWDNPDGALQQKQFLAALEACLKDLPERTAKVFLMREHLGLETKEICQELGITATHCWVMLYRARMSLRECLATNWFKK